MDKDTERFFARFTKVQTPRTHPLAVGDHVKIVGDIVGSGETGRVAETGIKMPWCAECIIVERDNTGRGIYMPSDVRRI